MSRLLPATALLVAFAACGCGNSSFTATGRVEKLAVTVETEATGALLIHEAFDIRPDSSGAIAFERRIEVDRADGIELVTVEADGARLVAGRDGLAVPTVEQKHVELRWTPPPMNDAVRRLVITLRAVSAIAVTEPRAGLTWPILAPHRGYDVDRVEVQLVLPAGSPAFPGTGIAEAGWTVERTPDGISAIRAPVVDGESATLMAAFDFDRAGVRDPVWERSLDRQRQFLPALLAAALFFFTIGVGTLVILRAQYPSKKRLSQSRRQGPSDQERRIAARGLAIAGIVGAVVAAGSAVLAANVLSFLGFWVQVIPASMLIVAAVFVAYAPRLRR